MFYDPKKHVKLKDLATHLKITYESMYLKQLRLGIKGMKAIDKETGKRIVIFTNAQAKAIMEKTAKKMPSTRITVIDATKQLNTTKKNMNKALLALHITPVRMRREYNKGNRAVLTIPKSALKRIKEQLHDLQ